MTPPPIPVITRLLSSSACLPYIHHMRAPAADRPPPPYSPASNPPGDRLGHRRYLGQELGLRRQLRVSWRAAQAWHMLLLLTHRARVTPPVALMSLSAYVSRLGRAAGTDSGWEFQFTLTPEQLHGTRLAPTWRLELEWTFVKIAAAPHKHKHTLRRHAVSIPLVKNHPQHSVHT